MMKKKIAVLLVGLMVVSMFAGCRKKQEEPVLSATPELVSVEVEEADPHEGQVQHPLTGVWLEDPQLATQRPFAVMIGNSKVGLPQVGISQADIIYEAPVEGGETRLMAIFQDYENLEKVMSVRSCRRYYIDWALEFDAIYGHYGQAVYALETLQQDYVNNLSGLEGAVEAVMYARDTSRKAPHNAYTTGEGILAGIDYKGYAREHSADYQQHYQFNKDENTQIQLTDGQDAVVVRPGYLVNKPWFVYDSESGLYKRYEYGEAHVDAGNDEQLQVKNILIQSCNWKNMDENGYLEMFTTEGGNGYYVTNGKAIPITWTKESQMAPTRYFDKDGNEITLNQGKTWVCVTQNTYEDRIAFFASEEEFSTAE